MIRFVHWSYLNAWAVGDIHDDDLFASDVVDSVYVHNVFSIKDIYEDFYSLISMIRKGATFRFFGFKTSRKGLIKLARDCGMVSCVNDNINGHVTTNGHRFVGDAESLVKILVKLDKHINKIITHEKNQMRFECRCDLCIDGLRKSSTRNKSGASATKTIV